MRLGTGDRGSQWVLVTPNLWVSSPQGEHKESPEEDHTYEVMLH